MENNWEVTEVCSMPETKYTFVKYCIKRNGSGPLYDIRRFLDKGTLRVFLRKQGFTFSEKRLREHIACCQKLLETARDTQKSTGQKKVTSKVTADDVPF